MNPADADNPADTTPPEGLEGVRFVVLAHTDRLGCHFDLMIDTGDGLATWKCPQPPEQAPRQGLLCRRLGDHRRIYLGYEGPISGDRGWVRRWDSGRCTVLISGPRRWEVDFRGYRLKGVLLLAASEEDEGQWCLRSLGG